MGRSNDKKPGRSTFVDATAAEHAADPSEAAAAVFTQTHADPLIREAPLVSPSSQGLEPAFLLDDEDPTKVLADAFNESDTEVGIPQQIAEKQANARPPPRPNNKPKAPGKTPRPKRRSKKQVDESFADEVANVSSATPVGAGDKAQLGAGKHPVSATQVGPSLLPFGRYHLVKRLAFGGMGEIWLAAQRAPGGFAKLVAIKRLLSHYQGDDNLKGMFFDEARLQALLSDRQIVQIYDMGEEDDHLYIAMEYVHGVSFKQILDRAKASGTDVPLSFICDLAIQACRGFSYAHNVTDARGEPLSIVHRDVNPHNLLVSFGGEVKLIDFGIAKSEMSAGRTETGTIKGKFAYMSPEQSAAEALDRRSDIFSFGIVLYELITGGNPFHRQNVVLSLEAIQRFTPPPLESLRPEAAALAPIVNRALSKEADDRYNDCGEIGEDILRLMESGAFDRQPCTISEWLHALFAPEIEDHAAVLKENALESGFVRRAPSGTSPGNPAAEMSDFARRTPSGALPASPSSTPPTTPPAGPPVLDEGDDVDLFSDIHSIAPDEFHELPPEDPITRPPLAVTGAEATSAPAIAPALIAAPMVAAGASEPTTVPPDTSPTSPKAVAAGRDGAEGIVIPPAPPKKKRSKLLLFLGATLGAFLTVSFGFGLLWFLQPETDPIAVAETPEALPEAAAPEVVPSDATTPPTAAPDAPTPTTQPPPNGSASPSNTAQEDPPSGVNSPTNSAASTPGTDAPGADTPGTDTPGTGKPATDTRASDAPASNTPATNKTADTKSATTKTPAKGRSRGRRGSKTSGTKTSATKTPPKVAAVPKVALGAKTLKGSSVGARSGTVSVGKSKTFKAKNAAGMTAEVRLTATENGAVATVKAKPWAIVRVGAASKGRTPVSHVVVNRRAAISLRHPKHGEISMILSAAAQ